MAVAYSQLVEAMYKFDKVGNYERVSDCIRELYYFDKAETKQYIQWFRIKMQKLVKDGINPNENMNLLWKSYLLTARDNFDDFCIYLEKNRELKSRFYIHRRPQLKPLVDALQDLADDKLDLLTISLPPGIGKLLADDTPVLTKDGWKNHGDLVVGDYVIGLDGKFKKVTAVHPKNTADCLVEFTNGEKIQCHENHQWLVHDRTKGGKKTDYQIYDTKTIESCNLESGGDNLAYNYRFYLPQRVHIGSEYIDESQRFAQHSVAFKSITRVEPKQGNCITVEGDGMYLVGKTLIPTHNSTLSIFYVLWLAGKSPNKPILTASHSNAFLGGVYKECLRILDINGEYAWHDVFPEVPVTSTNAQDLRIDLGKANRFETLMFGSVGSGNAGVKRAGTLLYCDDLIPDLETAMSKERLDKLWNSYSVDFRQRKEGDCKELHVATRWSVHDVIGRLESQYKDNPRARFISVPALDENDESNFDYPHFLPSYFTTEMYHEQREIMDDVSWKALYMNEPIEREGQLYNAEELRRYFELPDSDPDAIWAVCDTKDKGSDYCVLPIAYQYGSDYYIEDVVCDNSNPEIVEARLVEKLLRHRVHLARFESNSAGGRIAKDVQSAIKEKGGKTKITTKYSTTNKDTRIIVASGYAKEHFLFKDESVIKKDKEYRTMLNMLTGYTMMGKNKHDDVPDAIAMLVDFIDNSTNRPTMRVIDRIF